MNQMAIEFEVHPPEVRMVKLHPDVFAPDFEGWLIDNEHIWRAFQHEAHRAALAGFAHYSARTIVEFLRHNTAMREKNGAGWKINDHYTPDMARLYSLMNPSRAKLFEFRVQQFSSKRVA